ncbi:hypothetical protein HFV04_021715 [Pseudomonas sp. BIGb0427]|uniref:hypothetical protein n=1 Tax=Pseudomonas sp. BIGb0427 TaxID=2724470 RepID=UPI0016B2CA10|nr:hypothetical protein [Pseudomonas sp. BIGb0427]NLU60461.1 hypothetical protein [Pseudomonas sp. BIGb0427]QPG62120.1 hypothetical protein HFV04_021715 [Pseudomonas sp. BIGb0427]
MDRVVLAGCFMLLAVGLLIGLGVNSSTSGWSSIRDVFELASFAGTAVTAVVATVALTSWQLQFRHSEKWKAVKTFQDTLDGGDAAQALLNTAFNMMAANRSVEWDGKRTSFTDDFHLRQKAWHDQCYKANKAWSQITLLYEFPDLATLEIHEDIEADVDRVVAVLLNAFLRMDPMEPVDVVHTYQAVNECASRARAGTLRLFAQAGVMQKRLIR